MKPAGLVARKIGMTRRLDTSGRMIPVTLLQIEQQKVTKLLTSERDGYSAIQIGYFTKPERLLNKADLTRLKKSGVGDCFARFKEFRCEKVPDGLSIGAALTAELLTGVSAVDVTGTSKGRGFQGAIKRWGAKSGRGSHGSMYHNRTGSLGCRSTPGRVFKNKHMPGHLCDEVCTVQNLAVVELDIDRNVLALKGSVPGARNGIVYVKPVGATEKQA